MAFSTVDKSSSHFRSKLWTGTGSAQSITYTESDNMAPNFVWAKRREIGSSRLIDSQRGLTKYLTSNAADAQNTDAAIITSFDTNGFSLGDDTSVNASGGTYIAYYFAGKRGYSKFGNYTGNGNADGTFIYTGFKPAWIMAKKSNSTGDWVIVDTKRDGYNGANDTLQANVTDAEGGGNRFDIVSNGFKARSTSAYSNSSGDTFIYMAFAEAPLVDSTGKIPATAR